MSQSSSLLSFDQVTKGKKVNPTPPTNFLDELVVRVSPELNPYKQAHVLPDLYDLLPPDGSTFGLFSDPYATLRYINPSDTGTRNGKYWLEARLEDHSFSPREIKLLEFLAEHRLATRSQIQRIIFSDDSRKETISKFLKVSTQRGIICSFSWVSPLDDGRKKPRLYGLTKHGAKAAESLFHRVVPDDFRFHPVDFSIAIPPNMHNFFIDLAANELYTELHRLDRVISWKRSSPVRCEDGSVHYPGAEFTIIKDVNEFRTFWVEVCRTGRDWISKVKSRFRRTQDAFTKIPLHLRPVRLIIIADADSRIPLLGEMAHHYMPDVNVRFTTDERLLKGLDKDTFLSWNHDTQSIKVSSIPFFQKDHEGMKASEYFASQQLMIEDDNDFYDEE